jgi:hypothetical protein
MRYEPDEDDATFVSAADVPTLLPERRGDVRQVTVRLVAKLRTSHGEELCLVRNLSPGGLTAHVYSTLDVGAAVFFEFASGATVPATVLWQRDSLAGVQFLERIDSRRLLSRAAPGEAVQEPRSPRVELNLRARIRLGIAFQKVTLCNISQGGAKLRPQAPLQAGQKLVLLVDGLPPLAGKVQWERDGFVGVAFYEPVPFDLLAQWVPIAQAHAQAG